MRRSHREGAAKALLTVLEPPVIDSEDELLAIFKENWRRHRQWQETLCEQLSSAVLLRIVDDDTDLALACAGQRWVPVADEANLPVGEVAVCPSEQVTGHIAFPGNQWFAGIKITNLVLDFCGGDVVAVSATSGEEFARELCRLPGMSRISAVGLGTNAEIPTKTGQELLAEKFLGTVQITLGKPHSGVDRRSRSPISWNLVKDLRHSGVLEVNGQPLLAYGQLHPLLRPVLRAI